MADQVDNTEKQLTFKLSHELTDEQLADRIKSQLQRGWEAKAKDFSRCRRYDHIYRALDPPELMLNANTGNIRKDRRRFSNTYLPIGAAIVDTATVQIYNHIFPGDHFFEIDSDEWQDWLFAPKVTAHMEKRFREMKLKLTVLSVIQQCLCFDYSVTFARWYMRPGKVPQRRTVISEKEIGGLTIPYQDSRIEQVYVPNAIDRSDIQSISYFNCVHDPQAGEAGLEDSTHFIDWGWVPISELLLNEETPDRPWGKYHSIRTALETADKSDQVLNLTDKKTIAPPLMQPTFTGDRVRRIRYWTTDMVAEMVNGVIISRRMTDGMKAQIWKIYLKNGCFEGMGLLQRLERNQYDINAIINIKRDFQNRALTPWVAVTDNVVGLEEGDIELYSGKTVVVGKGPVGDQIKVFQPGYDISQGATEELSYNIQAAERVGGFGGENVQGAFSSGRKTAKEVMSVLGGVMSKVSNVAERLEDGPLKDVYMAIFKLEQINLTQAEKIRYRSAEHNGWIDIQPSDYAWNREPHFYCLGSGQQKEREMSLMLIFKAMTFAIQFPEMHDWTNILTAMWRLIDPRHYTRFLKDKQLQQPGTPPMTENELMAAGRVVQALPSDKHDEHRAVHEAVKRTPDYRVWPESYKMNLERHLQDHQTMGATSQAPRVNQQMQDESDMFRGMR